MARAPYTGNVEIDPSRVIVMLTSNKAEITPDLANRASIVRIGKQPLNYRFRAYPEGDLLAHVRGNQPRFLGAVFAIVRAWHGAGMPRSDVRSHDFRAWAGRLDWIVQNLLGCAPLLDGHRDAQTRVASPTLNWLHDLAVAVDRAGLLETPIRSHEILDILEAAGLQVPAISESDDLSDDQVRKKAFRAIGQRMGTYFRTGPTVCIDRYDVRRDELTDKDGRTQRSYLFIAVSRISPNVPESHPESKPLFPESPESIPNIRTSASSVFIEKYGSHSGHSGNAGNAGGDSGKSDPDMEVVDV